MAQYSAGTAAVTNGSQDVDFSGGADVHTYMSPGDIFTVQGSNIWYQIGSVHPTLQRVTLTANYAGSTNASVGYAVTRDFSTNYGFPIPAQGDLETASIVARAIVMIDAKMKELDDLIP
jgi:hypothetical protein